MKPPQDLVVGCATAIQGMPYQLRVCALQIAQQTRRPAFHAIISHGSPQCDGSLVSDVSPDHLILESCAEELSRATAFTRAIQTLFDRGVELFFCIEADDLYRTDYLEVVYQALLESTLDLVEGFFCVNLIKQQWIESASRTSTKAIPFHFRGGLGVGPEEQKAGQRVGAPGTFIFNRRTAKFLVEEASKDPSFGYTYHDILWRRTLLAKGVNITLIETPQPVYAYVSRKPEEVTPVAAVTPVVATAEGTGPLVPIIPAAERRPRFSVKNPQVSIVIPTYNEGDWLPKTIESLLKGECKANYEIIVVDDGGNDGSVAAIYGRDRVRVLTTDEPQSGLVKAKNIGAQAARGEFLCFIDSHMLVLDGWLDSLLQTCQAQSAESMVTCNIFDVGHHDSERQKMRDQYGYALSDWCLNVRWHHYGFGAFDQVYRVPLCPGGMMFMTKSRFDFLGGFATALRKWGSEDAEFSLRHYCAGGEIVADPNTIIYHYFKNTKTKKPSFSITFNQTSFNALYVARTYMSADDYRKVRGALTAKAKLEAVLSEIESGEYDESMNQIRALFVRRFENWMQDYQRELATFVKNGQSLESKERPQPVQGPMATV